MIYENKYCSTSYIPQGYYREQDVLKRIENEVSISAKIGCKVFHADQHVI